MLFDSCKNRARDRATGFTGLKCDENLAATRGTILMRKNKQHLISCFNSYALFVLGT